MHIASQWLMLQYVYIVNNYCALKLPVLQLNSFREQKRKDYVLNLPTPTTIIPSLLLTGFWIF